MSVHSPITINIKDLPKETAAESWLAELPLYPKVYWRNRSNTLKIAAAGVGFRANSLSELEALVTKLPADIPILGGMCFDPQTTLAPEWQDYGTFFFMAPQICLISTQQSTIKLTLAKQEPQIPLVTKETKKPSIASSQADWLQYHAQALAAIASTELQKIVLARAKFVSVTPSELLERTKLQPKDSYSFYFAPNANTSYWSSTPERLFMYREEQFICDCLGGTFWKQQLPSESRKATIEQEHHLILEDILLRLKDLTAAAPKVSPSALLHLNDISHLKTEISGVLKSTSAGLELLKILHPTAAVGGFPAAEAQDFIRRYEGFNRGWYAGPVGCIYNQCTEFAVGIRSILAHRDYALAFAGCGVVTGSNALDEWEETLRKFKSFGA